MTVPDKIYTRPVQFVPCGMPWRAVSSYQSCFPGEKTEEILLSSSSPFISFHLTCLSPSYPPIPISKPRWASYKGNPRGGGGGGGWFRKWAAKRWREITEGGKKRRGWDGERGRGRVRDEAKLNSGVNKYESWRRGEKERRRRRGREREIRLQVRKKGKQRVKKREAMESKLNKNTYGSPDESDIQACCCTFIKNHMGGPPLIWLIGKLL